MKKQVFPITRYDADEGMCFDWAEPHYQEILIDENNLELGTKQGKQEHLYATTLFIGGHDSIENYVEVTKPEE